MTADLDRLRPRVHRALGSADIGQVFNRRRAVVGPPWAKMTVLAQKALKALDAGREPTTRQLQALELAIRLHRPAPLVQHGRVRALGPDEAHAFPGWDSFRAVVEPFLPGIGRIDRRPDAGARYASEIVGTGFLVAPTVLATNRHVVDELSIGTRKLAARQAVVRFGQEYQVTPDPTPVAVIKVRAVHKRLDVALLTIEPAQAAPLLTLAAESAEAGRPVAALGYPDEDARNPVFVDELFGSMLGVKRAAPGEITDIRDGELSHDCTTLGGNSGSPIVAQDDGTLVGVHADGYFLARNNALCGDEVVDFLATGAESE